MSGQKNIKITLFAICIWLGFSASAVGLKKGVIVPEVTQQVANVMSFKEWKQFRLKASLAKYGELKKSLISNHAEFREVRNQPMTNDPNLKKSEKTELQSHSNELVNLEIQLKNEQMNYEMAKDLTVSDYFVGYLSKLSHSKSALRTAAEKLSPEEVAEIMSAFANTSRRGSGEQEIAPASRLIEMKDLEN